ncbi:glycoside hydrolase family 28 protein [Glaciimonas soli]|uniref:Glycoside hydrolase n=1 Tax=Glaciimonas soli TaxID=2590999 RepID=A0A843YQU2_9BURK|nr:glycosyl hydrolase family 28 protein [Glaciimonas soli]MQR01905.1 glycoside hydrolase [Glaciimonas soli]
MESKKKPKILSYLTKKLRQKKRITFASVVAFAIVLAGCSGGTGATGAAGVPGANGAASITPGPSGAQGATGPVGPAGSDGASGTPGTTGATGPAGPAGSDGASGTPGADGTNREAGYKVGLTTFDPALPPKPALPSADKVCSTLTANIMQLPNGLPPDSADDPALGAANSAPDTTRIQTALNNCGAGNAVRLVTGQSGNGGFISGPLTLPSGVTLWIDKSATLYASRDPRQFDKVAGTPSCGDTFSGSSGCLALITATATSNSAVMGDGTIDGRGGSRLLATAVDNKGNPFLRGDGSNVSWWDLAWRANKVGDAGTSQGNPRLILSTYSNNFTVYKIRLQNSPNFHIVTSGNDGVLVWGLKVNTPSNAYQQMTNYLGQPYSVDTAKNTDAFDPGGAAPKTINKVAYSGFSNNVVLAYSFISTGDDDFSPKGSYPNSNLTVAHNHFYSGHGVSIGSETNGGVSNMHVYDNSFDGDGTIENQGLRIKSDASKGGLVTGVIYENICMRNLTLPLVFDAYYSTNTGSNIPNFQNVSINGLNIVGGGRLTMRGYDAAHTLQIAFDNVVASGAFTFTASPLADVHPPFSNAQITVGPNRMDLPFLASAANNVSVTKIVGTASALPVDCSHAFVSFPL